MLQDESRHRERMQRKKQVVDQRIAAAQVDRGVLLVLTGAGKGKSSSAFGMVARALGHQMKVGVVQFIKGRFSTGEEAFFRSLGGLDGRLSWHVMGEGFTWETQDKARDIEAAQAAWAVSKDLLSDGSVDMVVLDELNIALKYGYLDCTEVVVALRNRPALQHAVVTGRSAPHELIEAADTVTEMKLRKHAFEAGVRAQKGVEL
ncbi:cob(I)yrinic acid a,c-diamide adenosyltransferase [Litorivivens sp.]|uniref:cob(I)yrinic acid a,c-diamide adenosyltransferase n=1 Tax=Litorivivens sp. TaxID=2020868 RepID=UPI00356550F5